MQEITIQELKAKRQKFYKQYRVKNQRYVTDISLYLLKKGDTIFELTEKEFSEFIKEKSLVHLCANCSKCSASLHKTGCQKVVDAPFKELENYKFITYGVSSDYMPQEKFIVLKCTNYKKSNPKKINKSVFHLK